MTRYSAKASEGLSIFPWGRNKIILRQASHFFALDLHSRNPKPQHVRLKGFENVSGLSHAGVHLESGLSHLGFKNGVLVLYQNSSEKPILELGPADSAITSFQLLPRLEVGVAGTALGTLTFWDLATGECLEKFSAHRDTCLLYTSPSPRDRTRSRMPSSA